MTVQLIASDGPHCTEVRFANFLFRWIYYCHGLVVNSPERKLANRTLVQCRSGHGQVTVRKWYCDGLVPVRCLSSVSPVSVRRRSGDGLVMVWWRSDDGPVMVCSMTSLTELTLLSIYVLFYYWNSMYLPNCKNFIEVHQIHIILDQQII